jgi:hypothetical protein
MKISNRKREVEEDIKVPTDGKIPENGTSGWLPPSVGATISDHSRKSDHLSQEDLRDFRLRQNP